MKDITIPLKNYHNLGEAIIKQAEEDYKLAKTIISDCEEVISEITTFLKSDWAKTLSTKNDPLIILEKLEKIK
jgi:hypothetical protein